VNNGKMASFLFSNWLDGGTHVIQFPELFNHSKRKRRSVAEALANDQWIRDFMHDFTVPLLDEFVKPWGLIEDVNFDSQNMADKNILKRILCKVSLRNVV
jgi:hypothetical protein